MNFFRNIPALIFTIIILAALIIIFSLNLTKVSIQDEFTEFNSEQVNSKIEVYEHFNGIPHVIAGNEDDMFFAMGYYHAKHRLWQMDFTRRVAEGRLSEVFGETTFKEDLFLRSLDLKNISKNSLSSISDTSLSVLESYSNGVNFFIEKNSHRLPFEFGALDYKPEKWKPYHSILISKVLSFEMSFSFWYDYLFSSISSKIGINKAKSFIPDDNNQKPVFNSSVYISENSNNSRKNFKLPEFDNELISSISKLSSMGYTGSNSWAITQSDTFGTHSILANDPHLRVELPARWYQIHLTSPDFNAIGYSIPGAPLLVIGRNNSISWGITNMMADICDIYLLKNGKDDDHYIDENGDEVKFEYTRDTIVIKNAKDYQYYAKSSKLSPVLDENHIWNTDTTNIEFFEKYDICFDWINKRQSDEFLSLYKLNKSSNISDFKSSLSHWNSPPLIFHYADTSGNVGIKPAGNIPKRNKTSPNFINPYWEKETHWTGIIGNDELPENFYNKNNYIYSANNKLVGSGNLFISDHWEPSSRAERIEKLMTEKNSYTVRDFQYIQVDYFSPYAEKLVNNTLPILKSYSERLNETETKALKKLENWNKILARELNEPILYNYFKRNLVELTFKDELEEDLYEYFVFFAGLPDRLLMTLLESRNHELFNNVKTDKTENKEVIIIKAFKRTVKQILNEFGPNGLNEMQYGEVRQLELKHIFSQNEFMNPAVSLGKLNMGGDNTTLFNTEARYTEPNKVVITASMRFIADMQDSVIYTILPGGVSGDPMSSHYGDQLQLWLNGGYLKIPVKPEPGADFELKTVINKSK